MSDVTPEEEALVVKLREILGDTDLAGATIRIDVGAGEVLAGQATDAQIVALYGVLSELGLAPRHRPCHGGEVAGEVGHVKAL